MAQEIITIFFFISVDIDNYHDKFVETKQLIFLNKLNS